MSVSTKPTKRELREQRRAERIAADQAEAAAAAAARRTRLWRLLTAVGVAAVVVAVAAIASSSGGKQAAPHSSAAITSLFRGIPEQNGVLGDPKAPVTVTEYVDLQCPVCAAASRATIPTILRDYVRTGKVKLEARTLQFIGPDSVRAARVAAGAARQGKLWPFLEAFYAAQGEENSGYVTGDFLRSVSAAAGVDAGAALRAADSAAALDDIGHANSAAKARGIEQTPTFTVARADGKARTLVNPDPQSLGKAIRAELPR